MASSAAGRTLKDVTAFKLASIAYTSVAEQVIDRLAMAAALREPCVIRISFTPQADGNHDVMIEGTADLPWIEAYTPEQP